MPGHEGNIWIAGDNKGIWHSTNSGATFTKLSNVTNANSIGFGKAAPGQNYMAIYALAIIDSIHGVFRSDDRGKTWIRINDNQHQYGSICCITGDPRIYGRVYFGTNGMGIIYGDISKRSSRRPPLKTLTKKTPFTIHRRCQN